MYGGVSRLDHICMIVFLLNMMVSINNIQL